MHPLFLKSPRKRAFFLSSVAARLRLRHNSFIMIFSDRQLRLIKRLIFLLIPYSILRVGFYFYHLNIYKQFTQEDIFESFLLGPRFDIAAICLLNIPVILLALVPKVSERVERFCFIFVNSLGFLSSIDDYELFLFVGKRLSFDYFVIMDDIYEQLPQVVLYYWYLPFVAGVAILFFYCLLYTSPSPRD